MAIFARGSLPLANNHSNSKDRKRTSYALASPLGGAGSASCFQLRQRSNLGGTTSKQPCLSRPDGNITGFIKRYDPISTLAISF
jgi:hypothetical protein